RAIRRPGEPGPAHARTGSIGTDNGATERIKTEDVGPVDARTVRAGDPRAEAGSGTAANPRTAQEVPGEREHAVRTGPRGGRWRTPVPGGDRPRSAGGHRRRAA